jgi:hypothetical protein
LALDALFGVRAPSADVDEAVNAATAQIRARALENRSQNTR